MKQCPRCAAEGVGPKPFTEFCKDKQTVSGLAVYCKFHKRAVNAAYVAKDPEACRARARAATRRWAVAHPEELKRVRSKGNKMWRLRYPERAAACSRRTRRANPEKYAALDKLKRQRKPELYAAIKARNVRRYQAAKLKRVPAWADHEKIAQVYEYAKAMTWMTNAPWHVDHIIPLQGKAVSGLHVHTNLQVLPGIENAKKGNRFPVELQ